jgi:acyl dehydratase
MNKNNASDLAEKFNEMVSVKSKPEVWEVEKGHIRQHAEAVGDPNPLWRDEAYARATPYGCIIAPPFLLIDAGLVKFVDKLVDMAPGMANINGGTEIDFYVPMKVGDVITSVAKLTDVKAKTGKNGDMIFLTVEVDYTNQRGELVTRSRTTFIRR